MQQRTTFAITMKGDFHVCSQVSQMHSTLSQDAEEEREKMETAETKRTHLSFRKSALCIFFPILINNLEFLCSIEF